MQITKIEAQNFLSFSNLAFKPDKGFTVVTGPNGSGKTNLIRAIQVVRDVVGAINHQQWALALRHGSEQDLCVRLSVALSTEAEQALFAAFLKGSLLNEIPENSQDTSWSIIIGPQWQKSLQQGNDFQWLSETYCKWIERYIQPEKIDWLFSGELVVRYFHAGRHWEVTFETMIHNQRIRWDPNGRVKRANGPSHSTLHPLGIILRLMSYDVPNPPPSSTVPADSVAHLERNIHLNTEHFLNVSLDDVLGTLSQPRSLADGLYGVSLPLYVLLPDAQQQEELTNALSRARQEYAQELAQRLGMPLDRSTYPIPRLWSQLLQRTLRLTENIRSWPREEWSIQDLNVLPDQIDVSDGSNLGRYLFLLSKSPRLEERKRFAEIRTTFHELTRSSIEEGALDFITTPVLPSQSGQSAKKLSISLAVEGEEGALDFTTPVLPSQPGQSAEKLSISLAVEGKEGVTPIAFAGAGIWEALLLSVLINAPEGSVLALDEPALNLHPSLQRHVLQSLQGPNRGYQVLLVTHSPYLVPPQPRSLVRLSLDHGATAIHYWDASPQDTSQQDDPELRLSRWLQRSVAFRSALFARGVILVEGEAELLALSHWWGQRGERSPEALNLLLYNVHGQEGLKFFANTLGKLKIPWAIVCDGKASPSVSQKLGCEGIFAVEENDFLDYLKGRYPEAYAEAEKQYGHRKGVLPALAVAREKLEPNDMRQRYDAILKRLGVA